MQEMLGTINCIKSNKVTIDLAIDIKAQVNFVGLHVVFIDEKAMIIGEIVDITQKQAEINIVGEIVNNVFLPGAIRKPAFRSTVRLVNANELALLFGSTTSKNSKFRMGYSNVYQQYPIYVDVNRFLSNHFAILGNTGSGKSFTLARLIQNIFTTSEYIPIGANILLFDAYGEYTSAFQSLSQVSPLLNYKVYTTNTNYSMDEVLKIPFWLLGVDDIALLLGVTTPNQLPIIEKALKIVPILKNDDESVLQHKNDIIARSIMDILTSSTDSSKIRDQVIAVLTKFHTKDLHLDSQIVQPGYVRTLKQCLYVDKSKMQEIELVTEFIGQFIIEGLELKDPDGTIMYDLADFEQAMSLSLISEGVLNSDRVYDEANVLLVRIHSLINSNASNYFAYPRMISKADYVRSLFIGADQKKCQIVNFNIHYVDDRLAKVITKILSKLIFDFAAENPNRGSVPFHIVIEEAHRYVQVDSDMEILGYNIFERITKEGRKYGVLLGLITQRPSELSDTAISQCSNFLILRTLHPKDLQYIKEMVPSVSDELMEQVKNLQPGNCIAFGSAFLVPTAMVIEKPNPEPLSNNVDVEAIWYQKSNQQQQ